MPTPWNTDLAAAPRGVDLVVSVWSADRRTCSIDMGMQVYEPYEWEDGEESGVLGDTEGTFDVHEGQRVCWYWLVGCDGYVDKKEIAAWQPAPAPYTPESR